MRSPDGCARSGRSPSPISGGADSALVLAAAVRGLGAAHVLAITAVSESLASGELESARGLADRLGARHLAVGTEELSRPGYRANGRDRCYFCKSEVLDTLAVTAGEHGYDRLATGTNADDAADPFRPGIAAGRERGVCTPLLDVGLTKDDVRAVSRLWSLPTWDKPADPVPGQPHPLRPRGHGRTACPGGPGRDRRARAAGRRRDRHHRPAGS